MTVVYGAIIKHKLRTARGMLKHFWPSFLGLLLGVAFLGYRLFVVVMGGGFGIALEPQYIFYLLCACVLLNGYRLLFKQTPAIRVNAATLHYLYHTSYFRKILSAEYLLSLIKNMLLAMLVAGFICGFQYDSLFLWNFLLLSGYLYSGILLSWIRYHVKGELRWVTIACYFFSSVGLFANIYAMRFALIGSVTVWTVYYVFFKPRNLNLVKYRKDIAFLDTNTASASQYDMVKMSQITAEHNANRKRRFLLYHLPLKKNNAIFIKCLIETIRAGSRIWIILIVFLIIGVLIYRTSILAGLPVIGDPAVATPLGVLLIMIAYANIGEILKKQLNTLLERHRLGLFLPVSHRQIFSSYILLGSLVYIVLTIFVGLLMGSKSYLTLIFFTLYSIVFAFDVFIEIRGRKFKQPIQTVLRIFSLMLGFLFVA
ncbi:MAG: hypothetical protein WCY37_04940 [Candidatus Dojkabacteria bacterium]|nr:hypothetical protein [Clostridiales bacterium]